MSLHIIAIKITIFDFKTSKNYRLAVAVINKNLNKIKKQALIRDILATIIQV